MNSKPIFIERLWYTQRCLKRPAQMPELIRHAAGGGLFDRTPLIELHENEDGEIVINNGHHRVTAVWLSGRTVLRPEEYDLFLKSAYRARFGRIDRFMTWLPNGFVDQCLQQSCVPAAG